MKMFNIFKKKPQPVKEKVKDNYNYDLMTYTINGKEYAICDSKLIKVQSVADDVHNEFASLVDLHKVSFKDPLHFIQMPDIVGRRL